MDRIGGRGIVITGAARGIGLATAEALLRRGARVMIGDRDVPAIDEALKSLSFAGAALGCPVDVTDPSSFTTFLNEAREVFGNIDVLINNAGVMPIGPFLELSEQGIRSALEVNLYGVINGCRLALPEMAARRSGQVVNIASMAGVMAVPGQAVYAATKFGVVGLSAALAEEFSPHGVRVSCVTPPFTRTELIAGTRADGVRTPIEPARVAGTIVDVIDKRKKRASIPAHARAAASIVDLMPDSGRRWVGRVTGSDEAFLDFDSAAREAYERRAQSSIGTVESRVAES